MYVPQKMKIKDLLQTTAHRAWPLPLGNWKYYQEWNKAIFIHFEVNIEHLQKLIPTDLQVDTFNGKAYVSIVPFTMKKTRIRNLPPFKAISNFDEINIRTYVKYNNKAGVHFLSIEGSKISSCKIAKTLSKLPYRFSMMKRTKNIFTAKNKLFKDFFSVKYKVGPKTSYKSDLELWLTERYALFQHTRKTITEYEIHHVEWPTHEIKIEDLSFNYPRFGNLFSKEPILVQYSHGVQVIAWDKKSFKRNSITN